MIAKRIALSLAAVGLASLTLSGSGLVHAQTDAETSTRGLVGEVQQLDVDRGSFLLIQNGTGDEFTVSLNGFDATTGLTTPGGQDQFRDGAQVAVLVDDDLIAVKIMVKPSQPTVLPFSGAVTSVENGTLTIVRPGGETMTVQMPYGERSPQAGAVVMGFARASDSRGAPPVTTGLTTAEEMRSRLEGFLDQANSAAQNRPQHAGPNPQERSAQLAEVLASHTAQHVAILQGVLDQHNLSDKAKGAVMRARSRAEAGWQRALATVLDIDARGKPEDARGRGSVQPSDGS